MATLSTNLWELYRRHMEKREYGPARAVLQDVAKLKGLDKVDVTVHVERPLKDMTDEELDAA